MFIYFIKCIFKLPPISNTFFSWTVLFQNSTKSVLCKIIFTQLKTVSLAACFFIISTTLSNGSSLLIRSWCIREAEINVLGKSSTVLSICFKSSYFTSTSFPSNDKKEYWKISFHISYIIKIYKSMKWNYTEII